MKKDLTIQNNLDDLLDELIELPGSVSQQEVGDCLKQTIQGLPIEQQLQTVARTLEQLAQALNLQMEQFTQNWADQTHPDGPAIADVLFAGMVRSRMELDLDHLKLPAAEPKPIRVPMLPMPLVEVWLGLLLGGYCLERTGTNFYLIEQLWVAEG